MASLDLRKAFDRVEHLQLFSALRAQRLPECYIHFLAALYRDQTGTASKSRQFSIKRGIRQGDVLSPLLFNAALESAFRSWKTKLRNEDILLSPQHERLTNIRYADDIMLFSHSLPELKRMMALLQEDLLVLGLEFNTEKTKILTTLQHHTCRTNFNGHNVDVLEGEQAHAYLGRRFAGQMEDRGQAEVTHRIQLAWMKYSHHRNALQNRHVPVNLRLKLFDGVVSPTALYCLSTVPLGVADLNRIDVVQRKMLRNIAGWVRKPPEPWSDTMRRMKQRLEHALAQHPIPNWSEAVVQRKQVLLTRVLLKPDDHWTKLCVHWRPGSELGAKRSVGRPRLRWDSALDQGVQIR